jgi:hypothetical protein
MRFFLLLNRDCDSLLRDIIGGGTFNIIIVSALTILRGAGRATGK